MKIKTTNVPELDTGAQPDFTIACDLCSRPAEYKRIELEGHEYHYCTNCITEMFYEYLNSQNWDELPSIEEFIENENFELL